ncbi:hypothetical protein SASPL_127296 [Salvia splendens]|uniref:RRM domain-containing protein n=1 Tax=Salvia splendens TaxID=180675 RepID=A0A8X8ZSF8_SALSN|nr:hypothetical protein SASPL_127296 [Salvia splendens]
MAKKRKTPSSLHTNEHKQAVVREEAKVLEKEEEEEEEESFSAEDEEEEGEDETSKQEALQQLLEPFGKSQIIDLLKEAAVKDPKLLPKIVQKADSDPAHRKIFVFGLGWDATTEQLVQAFKSFGEIEESKLITDKNTGRAKGYAFVMFKTRAAAKKALKVPQKRIGNRTVTCQLAAIGASAGTVVAEGGNNRIMYVANVAPHVNFEKLKSFFGRFGEIEEGPLRVDPVTNKFKGFAIITYKSTEGYKKAMEEPIKVVENCQLHCKKFVENFANNSSGQTSNSSVNPAATDVNYSNLGMNTGNALLAAGYDQACLAASIFGASMSGNYGINSISPTVMGRYGAQEAYNGLRMYQNSQTGLSSIGRMGTATTATTETKVPTSGGSASTTFSSYFNR